MSLGTTFVAFSESISKNKNVPQPQLHMQVYSNARRSRRSSGPGKRNSCCHTLKGFQPRLFSSLITTRSRALFRSSFASQNSRFVAGTTPCTGQPCQKQPSTNTATRCFGKTKSGRPKTPDLRRHPTKPLRRNTSINRNSVDRLPCPLTSDMICERFFGEKTSTIRVLSGGFL